MPSEKPPIPSVKQEESKPPGATLKEASKIFDVDLALKIMEMSKGRINPEKTPTLDFSIEKLKKAKAAGYRLQVTPTFSNESGSMDLRKPSYPERLEIEIGLLKRIGKIEVEPQVGYRETALFVDDLNKIKKLFDAFKKEHGETGKTVDEVCAMIAVFRQLPEVKEFEQKTGITFGLPSIKDFSSAWFNSSSAWKDYEWSFKPGDNKGFRPLVKIDLDSKPRGTGNEK